MTVLDIVARILLAVYCIGFWLDFRRSIVSLMKKTQGRPVPEGVRVAIIIVASTIQAAVWPIQVAKHHQLL